MGKRNVTEYVNFRANLEIPFDGAAAVASQFLMHNSLLLNLSLKEGGGPH
jgi:hypothetical protein